MTRESIKEFLMQIELADSPNNRWKPEILCEMIDNCTDKDLLGLMTSKIYDDFESRTCESCKFYNYDRIDAIALCENEDNLQEYLHDSKMQITSDFGCNKHEKKYN